MTCEYDITVLSKRVTELIGMLPARGQEAIKTEAGQLAGRMGDACGPVSRSYGYYMTDKEVQKAFTILPFSNLEMMESEKFADFTWLYASPYALVGINDEDNISKQGNQEAIEVFYAGRKLAPRGKSYVEIGRRGKQHIMRLNKPAVSAGQMSYVKKAMRDRVGQLKASFYRIAKAFVPNKPVPAWIERKFDSVVSNGKSKYMEAPDLIEMTVTAPGVVENPKLVAKLQGAINWSTASVQSKLKKLAQGAKYVIETGQVYFPKDNE